MLAVESKPQLEHELDPVKTTLGWDNFRLGQLWAGTTLIWANYVWDNFGPGNFGPDNNGWYNFELIPGLKFQISEEFFNICHVLKH